MSDSPRILVVGAGLAGCLCARLLGQTGHRVLVCEKRDDPRGQDHVAGRSINLAISERGIHGLECAGLREQLLERAIPMRGRMIHKIGESTFQPYSADPNQAINSVSRSELNLLLIEGANECDSVEFKFGMSAVAVDPDRGDVQFEDDNGNTSTEHADIIIGADGAGSAIRFAIQRRPNFNYSQSYLDHGYKELSIPAVTTGPHAPFALQPEALHIWPRGASMMIALPNLDGSFTCTLFWPYSGGHSFDAVSSEDAVSFFEKHYPDAVAVMPNLTEEFRTNPVSALGTVRCRPWHQGKVVLIGDAAHAIVPFYGQGANASFGDAIALADRISQMPNDVPAALQHYYEDRVEHADAIADMALQNFLEMRDHTAQRSFRAKKSLERTLHKTFGDRFLPLYEMVSFTRIPYADARRRAERQWAYASGALAIFIAVFFVLLALLLAWD